jgi:hypothetical protein
MVHWMRPWVPLFLKLSWSPRDTGWDNRGEAIIACPTSHGQNRYTQQITGFTPSVISKDKLAFVMIGISSKVEGCATFRSRLVMAISLASFRACTRFDVAGLQTKSSIIGLKRSMYQRRIYQSKCKHQKNPTPNRTATL